MPHRAISNLSFSYISAFVFLSFLLSYSISFRFLTMIGKWIEVCLNDLMDPKQDTELYLSLMSLFLFSISLVLRLFFFLPFSFSILSGETFFAASLTMIGKRIEVCLNDLMSQRAMKQRIWIMVNRCTRCNCT